MSRRPIVQIKELETSARLSRPSVVVGVPDVGLVGTIIASFLIEKLKLPELGYIESDLFPPLVLVQDSEPKEPVRIFGKGTLAVVIAEVPLMGGASFELASELARWTKAKQGRVIGLTGIPSEGRVESGGKQAPVVLAVANVKEMRNSITAMGAEPFEHGIMGGIYAALLKRCTSLGVPNLTLLTEAYPGFPDPGAAAAAARVLNKFLQTDIDVTPLLDRAEEIRLKMRGLMSQTQQAIQEDVPQNAQTPQTPQGVYH